MCVTKINHDGELFSFGNFTVTKLPSMGHHGNDKPYLEIKFGGKNHKMITHAYLRQLQIFL